MIRSEISIDDIAGPFDESKPGRAGDPLIAIGQSEVQGLTRQLVFLPPNVPSSRVEVLREQRRGF